MTSSSASPLLAVVIPAYRGRHLKQTLESFATQTDRRFRVYVGDDCSPDDLASIVAPFRERLDLVFKRFETNVGQTSLIKHYHRTIALATEPWLWVFSDDDLVAPDCVESFLRRLSSRGETETLFRFQMTMVDEQGGPMPKTTAYPPHETWADYTRGLMRPDTWVVVPNVIFRRSIYQETGGFYDFPRGLWSDLLSWARLSYRGGLETLAQGRVFFRQHAASTSADLYFGPGDKRPLIECARLMVTELRQLCAQRGASKLIPPSVEMSFYCRQFRFLSRPLTAEERALARKTLRELWPSSPFSREVMFEWHRMAPRLRSVKRWLRGSPGRQHPSPT